MTDDGMIVSIEPALHSQAIDRLIDQRKTLLGNFINMNRTELRAAKANFYQEAFDAKIVRAVNLVIRQAGSRQDDNRMIWESQMGDLPIHAEYDIAAKTTHITVGRTIVLSNRKAEAPEFIPGDWLYEFAAAYVKIEAEKVSKARMVEERESEDLILDLSARL